MRRHYVIATAGHVDHGKTSLVLALTGKDCDTHPEEKQRGITIYLGFSHIQLADEVHAGIVDVPGHKDFIDTMISGIHGIDLVLFIIAADESFMPQTYEHLQILQTLGVKTGIIIITKCDLVDKDLLYLAKDEVREKVTGTFLENARIITTSVVTGKNIDKIKPAMLSALSRVKRPRLHPMQLSAITPATRYKRSYNLSTITPSFFRYYPDRFFQVRGFGSVVTGTVRNGSLSKNQPLYVVPGFKEVKVRSMEAYGNETEEIKHGQRASLNLTNFTKEDYTKGIMLSDRPYNTTSLIDVELALFDGVPTLSLWATVEFHTSTIQSQARLHLIDKDKLPAGQNCLAQIHLDKAVGICYGDTFIIRNSSGVQTLGGGRVIDAFPLHHRRRTEKVKELLAMRSHGSLADLISTEIEKTIKPISLDQIANKFMDSRISLLRYQPDFFTGKLLDKYTTYGDWFWLQSEQDKLEVKVEKFLQVAHKNNPMDENGKSAEELYTIIHDFPEASRLLIMQRVLQKMMSMGQVELRHGTYALTTHKVNLTHKDYVNINWIDQYLLNQKMRTPLMSDLTDKCKTRGIDEKRLKQILFYLIARKRVIYYNGEYLHAQIVNPVRTKLIEYLKQHPEGCSVSQFRDLIGGNRKICVILFNIFDKEGIITRDEDDRRHLRL